MTKNNITDINVKFKSECNENIDNLLIWEDKLVTSDIYKITIFDNDMNKTSSIGV